ncbi:MAG: small multi-drug export protein [Endomicrobia bacterium]|nr:small multi-drug export protein [Endomicrobiia bacterium]MCX7941079.1 small multi-drug export protein [Endomicrobiia bacterium]MDW8055381.1 small multi-drug export protein [Elusimicrobiota bacterium]
MTKQILDFFSGLPEEFVVIILSFLPISELRGAIPVGIGVYQLGIAKTVLLSILGNFSFVLPFLWFLNNLHKKFMQIRWYNKFFSWWYKKVKSRAENIEKYEYLGLAIFVGIPLPVTGAWSGCVASYLLGLNPWKSAIAIFVGIIIACIIVTASTIATTGVINVIR